MVVDNALGLPARSSSSIQSVKTCFSIVDILAAANKKLSLSKIAAAANMAPSNVHRYLASLCQVGLVVQDPLTSHYGLGPTAIRIGSAALRQIDLHEVAHHPLHDLQRRTGQMACLSVWSDTGPIIVQRLNGDTKVFPITVRVGAQMSLTRHAAGHLFLAFLPETVTKPVLDELLQNRTDALAFKHVDLDKVRSEQLSCAVLIEGFYAVAAPIFNHMNEMVATCSVVGIPAKTKDNMVEYAARAVQDAAREISIRLGQDIF